MTALTELKIAVIRILFILWFLKELEQMATPIMNGAGIGALAGKQKTVLITGVSRGLGKSLALELAKLGHTIIGCARTQENLNALQSQLSDQPTNNKHFFMTVDVVSHSSFTIFVCIYMYISAWFGFGLVGFLKIRVGSGQDCDL